MNSKSYNTGIIIRVALIVLTSLLLAYLSFRTNYLYSISALFIIVAVQAWLLIRYILKRGQEIKRMLDYIKENNPTIYFSQKRNHPFKELGSFLNEIGDIVREVRIEKENQFQYMQYIIQHAGTGLLSFDNHGNIEIINQAAKELLGVPEISTINVLEKTHPGIPATMKSMKPGEHKVIIYKSGERLVHLALRISLIKIGLRDIRLVSLQDIKNELDEKEMDSWQKLIRVLTHEIVNSVTSVTSITSTISGFFKEGDKVIEARDLPDENILEALTGLGYIEQRGNNLIDFVKKFRSLTKLPAPKFEEIKLEVLLNGITMLKKDELAAKGIDLKCHSPSENKTVYCDRGLTEHMLLNLVNNAVDAVENNSEIKGKSIEIKSFSGDDQRPVIAVTDNGTGIPDELLDNIFIPFFTTKEHGSGIGLSLSRQIMKLHGGTISVFSRPGIETVFTLKF